jgi:transcriptional regulator with XRE-family HTH domain
MEDGISYDSIDMKADDARSAAHAALAANVRRLRIASHLSLSQLALATGVGKATLSAIERRQANATVETIAAIAAVLRVPAGELLSGAAPDPVHIVRHGAGESSTGLAGTGRQLDDLSAGGPLAVWEITLKPGERRELAPIRAGRRALYVLEGAVLGGPVDRLTELVAGDYLSCSAVVATQLEAEAGGARVLVLLGSR